MAGDFFCLPPALLDHEGFRALSTSDRLWVLGRYSEADEAGAFDVQPFDSDVFTRAHRAGLVGYKGGMGVLKVWPDERPEGGA
jgi:hypothetical protein